MDGDRGADEHQVKDSECHQQSIECVFPQLGRSVKWNDKRYFTFLAPFWELVYTDTEILTW